MKTYFSIDSFSPKKSSVVTLGAFDGFHLGHLSLMNKVLKKALEKNYASILLSFDPHPRVILQNEENFKYLTTLSEKKKILQKTTLGHFIIEPFTKELASLDPEKFIKILIEKLFMKHLIIGYDHHLGQERKGNFENLKKLSIKYNFYLEAIPAYELEGQVVSSTKIKKALLVPDLAWANKGINRPYNFCGKVVTGNKLGSKLGFPTANIDFEPTKFLPKEGVYAVKVLLEKKTYFGLLNLGMRPTFLGNKLTAEVYILDFQGSIYAKELCVFFLKFIREEQKFSSTYELKNQIKKDEKEARYFFNFY